MAQAISGDTRQTADICILLYFIIVDECARTIIALLKQQLVLLGQGFVTQDQ
jgi:hypothetical protein